MPRAVIGKIVKRLREEMGWIPKTLAKKLDVEHTTVGRWEDGSYEPSDKNRRKLEDLFGLSRGALDLSEEYQRGMTDTINRMARLVEQMRSGMDEDLDQRDPSPREVGNGETKGRVAGDRGD